MADPDHVAELDAHDARTVWLYRGGLLLSALGLVGTGLAGLLAPEWMPLATVILFAGAALGAADMHLYDKRIRWVIGAAGWLGAALLLLAAQLPPTAAHWVGHAGLGFVFVTLSGFALKEQFCFRIPFLRLVPVLLAASLIPSLLGQGAITGIVLLVAGGLYLLLAGAKLRMPLHYDIGDKSKYQV